MLEDAGMTVERVYKVKEGRPNVVDLIKGERIHLIVNTPHGAEPWFDEKAIRRAAVHGADSDHYHACRPPAPPPRASPPCSAGSCGCRHCSTARRA